MSATQAVFVLVHGGWHNHSAWDRVAPILEADGFAVSTLDLPGAGVHAKAPSSLALRPFDPAAFAAERSPMAGITQEERTQAVGALVKEATSLSEGKIILVGHSAGEMTISAVAEQAPDLLLAVVYLAGFMKCRTACRCSRCSSMKPCLRRWRLGCSWATPWPSARRESMPDHPTKPTDRCSKRRFMATCRSPNSRMRRHQLHCDRSNAGFVAHRKLHPEDLAPCRATISAVHKIARSADRSGSHDCNR